MERVEEKKSGAGQQQPADQEEVMDAEPGHVMLRHLYERRIAEAGGRL